MLTADERDRLCIVLVGARNPGNIGAAARAMQDFGFGDLRFVNDYTAPVEAATIAADPASDSAAVKAAISAGEILRRSRTCSSLAQAVDDCTLVIGTTAIGDRAIEQPLLTMKEAARSMERAMCATGDGCVALVFGSEKTGLTRDQLSHCTALATIPMYAPAEGRHLSMNLGQAVAVCLYELVRGGFEGEREAPAKAPPAATSGDRERLTQLLLEVMHATEYTRRFPGNAQELLVRRMAQSLGPSHAEAEMWMGFLRQVLWSTKGRTGGL